MQTRVQKWGNSQGIRVSKDLLADADIEVGDVVEIVAREGSLVVVPRARWSRPRRPCGAYPCQLRFWRV
jgi:antitoxin MazE